LFALSPRVRSVDDLSEMQVYIGREMIEEYRAGQINRRTLLKRLTMICGGAMGGSLVLAACGDSENAGMIMNPDSGVPGGPDAGAPTDARPPGALSVPTNDPAVQGSRVQYDSTGGSERRRDLPGPAGRPVVHRSLRRGRLLLRRRAE
jgi:hypothetical protein